VTASRNPVSLEQIELQIIGYYAHQFHVGVHTISSTTDLKRHFNFTFSDWAAEAKHLSELDWIKRLGVSLAESEMNSNPTTAELARLIQSKLDDNAAMVGQVRSIGVRETPNQGDYVVWYGTNRRPVDLNDSTKGYSAERDSKMHYGICKVYIPRSHQIGSLGAPWWKRTLTGQDDRLKLFAVKEMVDSAYWQAIASHMSDLSAPERQALIFVHGYNSSFQHAALRAAQIGFDLGIKGAMAFFSWPSLAATGSYAADEATIDASELMMTDFLGRLCRPQHRHVRPHYCTQHGQPRRAQSDGPCCNACRTRQRHEFRTNHPGCGRCRFRHVSQSLLGLCARGASHDALRVGAGSRFRGLSMAA
jgi:hypothetical protein